MSKTRATLPDIVPLARALSSRLAIIMLEHLHQDQETVACCKYCSACCKYLIPLSIPEAFRLNDEIMAMPEQFRQQYTQSFVDAAEKILRREDKSLDPDDSSTKQSEIDEISKWYSKLELSCPMLFDDLCTLYDQRPLACREHIVTGSSELCPIGSVGEPRVVRMPVSILDVLGELTAELTDSEVEAVILPLAMPWAQENVELSIRAWPAKKMVNKFIAIVKSKLKEYAETQLASV